MARVSKEKNAEYQRRWYLENRELQIQRNKENMKRKKDYVKQYKSERGCSRCDEKHVACLQFHHTNPEEKVGDLTKLLKNNISLDRIIEEINKCEILCANCHFKQHWQERLDKGEEPDILELAD